MEDEDFNVQHESRNLRLERSREYYKEKREEIIETKRKYRSAIRAEAVSLLGGRCMVCGYSKCLSALSVRGFSRGKLTYVAYWNRVYHKIKQGEKGLSLICENCKTEEKEKNDN